MGLGMVLELSSVTLNPGHGLVATPQDVQSFRHHGAVVEVTVSHITGAMQDFEDFVNGRTHNPPWWRMEFSLVPSFGNSR